MSLNFSFKDCTPPEGMTLDEFTTSPFDKDNFHPVADALVWLSMFCGFNRITKANVDDVISRIALYEKLFGPYLNVGRITRADVEMFVGMHTNVAPEKFHTWASRIVKQWTRSQDRIRQINVPSVYSRIEEKAGAVKS